MASTIITSVVTGGSNNHATVSEEANAYATDFVSQGVLGSITNTAGAAPTTGSFGVNQNTGSDMNIKILGSGNTTSTYATAYVTCSPSSQDIQVLRARMSADYTAYSINSNSSGSTKYDWIYLQASATNANTPSSAADNVITLYTSRSSSNTADNGSPPTYGILLAVVTVANGATAITNANITDKRTQIIFNTGATTSTTGWNSLGYPLTYSAYNGNHSYTLTTPNDLRGVLTNGSRLSISRSVAPPTQCTSLNGTNQYYSKSSPAGMTFTNNFVVSAWVKLASYPASVAPNIVGRRDANNGWDLTLTANGQIKIEGFNTGLSNSFSVLSYQSIPLNKWVHIAAQMDMTGTATTGDTNSYILLDGVEIPSTATRTGTNPTSLLQGTGDLNIGAITNGSTAFFPGKIAQVAIYNAKVTQANIVATISQSLAGTETSLISAYSFNNSLNDLNANANNLTAQNGAAATIVDSPFGATEYGIITGISYSNPTTTLTVQTPEGSAIPNQTLNTPQYSGLKIPFGFPAQKEKWRIKYLNKVLSSIGGAPTANTWYNSNGTLGSPQLNVPIGEWDLGHTVTPYYYKVSALSSDAKATLSTANNTESDAEFTVQVSSEGASSTIDARATLTRSKGITNVAQTTYYLNFTSATASIADLGFIGTQSPTTIIAECAYL